MILKIKNLFTNQGRFKFVKTRVEIAHLEPTYQPRHEQPIMLSSLILTSVRPELDFKDTQKGVNIHRIVGYGNKLSENPNLREKIATLQKRVLNLEEELEVPLTHLKRLETELQQLLKKETKYREKSAIINGKRVFKSEKTEQPFNRIKKEINKLWREKNNLKKSPEKPFKSLEKNQKELSPNN